jgi:dihydropteroate synthase
MIVKSKEILPMEYSANGKILTFAKPVIMAIVNLTPDSFYDGGKYSVVNDVLSDVEEKISQGAEIIDLGAASSRPNARETDESAERERLLPVLQAVRKIFPSVFISIDTFRSTIASAAASEGADIINDISGGSMDRNMFDTIAKLQLPYVLMHMDGTPQTMSGNEPYNDVVRSVTSAFTEKVTALEMKNFNKIILDPGFGFGKSLQNNYQLLKSIAELRVHGYPLLAGISRKSMINKVIGTNPVTSLNGTTVINTIALLNGAGILRVHDVAEAKQAIGLVEFYRNS